MDLKLDFRRYRAPLRVPVRTGHGVWAEREGLLLKATAGDGSERFAEVAPVPHFGAETVDGDVKILEALGGRLDRQALASTVACPGALRGALGLLLGDEVPLPVYDSVAVAALLPAGRGALARAAEASESGFRAFKWKVGVGDATDEMAILGDLLAALPQKGELRLDANGAWDTRTAQRWLERIADFPVAFVEQPLEASFRGVEDYLIGMQRDYPTTLALDESVCTDADLERWIGLGWKGVVVVKPLLLASPSRALQAIRAAGLRAVFSSCLETRVGASTALRWAMSWEGPRAAVGFGVWPLFANPAFDGPAAAPFIRLTDLDGRPDTLWNALS
jgi:o-succinylbenzoate synthase